MMTENKEVINEDGHTDVPSAKRQCKTIIEDAQAIMGVLDGMNPEDALPTWWTNKLAVASNSMNKMNDYLSNPTEQKNEEYGAGEWGSDELVANYKNATPGESADTIDEALPPHLAKLFDKDGNFKDKKKQKMYNDMMKRKAKPADVMRAMSRDVTPKGFGPNEALDHLVAEAQEMGMYETSKTEELVEEVQMENVTEGRMKELHMLIDKGMSAEQIAKKMKLDVKTIKALMPEEVQMEDLDSLIEEVLEEAPKMKYALVGTDMKIYSMGSDERDLKMDRRSLEKRFKDVAPLKMARLKTAQKIGDTVDKSQLKEETVISEGEAKTMERMGVSRSLVDSVRGVLAGKPKVDRTDIPEEILDDDVADFIGAASKAAAAGKKEFKFGDKTYPVTIKKKTADKISKKMDEDEHEAPSDAKKAKDKRDEKMGKKEPVEIDPELKEALDKDDEPKVKEIIKKLKGASAAHAGQAKDLEKAMSEAEMTDAQMKKREEIVKELKKKEDEFKERYGDRYKEVMYATATKMAMKSVDEIFGLGKKKKPTTSKPAQKRPAPKKRKPGVSVSQATTGTNLGF